jgi:transaldolase
MKIFAATGDLDEIQWAGQTGLIDGILLPGDFDADAEFVCTRVRLPVCVRVDALGPSNVNRARELTERLGDQTSVRVPFCDDALETMRQLRDNGVRVVATSIATAAQAMLAAKIGIWAVAIDIDELDRRGRDGEDVIRESRALFDRHGTSCEVFAVSRRDAQQFSRCARAGADIIGVEPDLLHALLVRAAS